MSFAELQRLNVGSLIRLPSSAGEMIAVHTGDIRLGSGEVLVVDGVLTVRMSEISAPAIGRARSGRKRAAAADGREQAMVWGGVAGNISVVRGHVDSGVRQVGRDVHRHGGDA